MIDIRKTYKNADPEPRVDYSTFSRRIQRRIAISGYLSEEEARDSLHLHSIEYSRKYAIRRTTVEINGIKIDLLNWFESTHRNIVSYSTFRQRVKSLERRGFLDSDSLNMAISLPKEEWGIFFGGGRRRSITYKGEEFPEFVGKIFHSIASFLKTIGRYEDRGMIWAPKFDTFELIF